MGTHGCYITDMAMILSYFNDRPFYPDQMLEFLKRKRYVLPDARVFNKGLEDAAGFKLRFSYRVDPLPGDRVYGMRQVYFGPIGHWVIDHPLIPNKVIDPFDGQVKNYTDFAYTGQNRYFIGKQ